MSLCQFCRDREANVSITKMVKGTTQTQKLCEVCARERTADAEFFADLPEEITEACKGTVEEIVANLLDQHFPSGDEWEEFDPFADAEEFPGDEDLVDELDELDEAEADFLDEDGEDWTPPISLAPSPPVASRRCSRCETTWDRLRQDGRAGCPHCYTAFADELRGVMERLQRGDEHIGKAPRAALKRRRRLEHLRKQRDNRLALLEKRLSEAVAAERYEEAAGLRDKIKVVHSTFVDFG